MDVVNSTRSDARAMLAVDKTGRPWLTVAIKSTYRLAGYPGAAAQLAPKQNKLLTSDVCEGEPGLSDTYFESDLVPFKTACDVVVKASANVPWAKAMPTQARHVDVRLRVESRQGQPVIDKAIRVYGARQWRKHGPIWSLTTPEPFVSLPLTYSKAFGGLHEHTAIGSKDPADFDAHPMNLIGRGHASREFSKLMQGASAHQTEAWVNGKLCAIATPHERATPASLGPIARNWQPRLALAGTIDDAWREQVFPLLPADFSERFYQCAPIDQQMHYPQGGAQIHLVNLCLAAAQDEAKQGVLSFRLPRRVMPIVVLTSGRQVHALPAVIDTVAIDADAMTFDITWRARLALQRSLHEVHTVAIGAVSRRWWDGRVSGRHDCAGCGDDEPGASDLYADAISASQ